MKLKKYLSLFVMTAMLLTAVPAMGADEQAGGSGFIDDSLRDISIVLGSGAAGAILGLSTLSFVERPSDHVKNIAIGGAIGVVVGVATVIYLQAQRTTAQELASVPMNPAKFDSITRHEFQEQKIVSSNDKIPSFTYNFSF